MNSTKEGIFTTGQTFRAYAEAKARSYRSNVLNLPEFDKYGHILSDSAGKKGMNFLPALRDEIFRELLRRNNRGKGINMIRTTKNMLSSQAMCFNLFVPLNLDKSFAATFFNLLLGDCSTVLQDIDIEYTPSKTIFKDQSGRGGVDCDALLVYKKRNGEKSLMVIETKYVEQEFSICGFRKGLQKDPCINGKIISPDFSSCRYQYKKHYDYWKVGEQSDLFDMNLIQKSPCPFGGSLWQLWVNMSLAFALSKEMKCDDFCYAVICPENNVKLTEGGQVFNDFRKLLKDPEKLKIIYLGEIKKVLNEIKDGNPNHAWTDEFIERYCF